MVVDKAQGLTKFPAVGSCGNTLETFVEFIKEPSKINELKLYVRGVLDGTISLDRLSPVSEDSLASTIQELV
jgi:hypothetical protein